MHTVLILNNADVEDGSRDRKSSYI